MRDEFSEIYLSYFVCLTHVNNTSSSCSSSWLTEVEGDLKAHFSRGRGGCHSFLLCFHKLIPVIKLVPICRPHMEWLTLVPICRPHMEWLTLVPICRPHMEWLTLVPICRPHMEWLTLVPICRPHMEWLTSV